MTHLSVCVCVCVCVFMRERERERERARNEVIKTEESSHITCTMYKVFI